MMLVAGIQSPKNTAAKPEIRALGNQTIHYQVEVNFNGNNHTKYREPNSLA
jgi:hypothetical protein